MKWLNRDLITGPYYGLCTTKQDFRKVLQHLEIDKDNWPNFINTNSDATCHVFKKRSDLICIVCLDLNIKVKIEQFISLLVHESVHIWQEYKESIGETKPSNEFEAYSIQRISQSLITEFLKKKKVIVK